VKRSASHRLADADADAGFLLIEAQFAAALVAVAAGVTLAAAAAAAHASAHALPAATLTASAQNVLTDLRAATAYDATLLTGITGRSIAFDAAEPGPDGAAHTVHFQVTVTPWPPGSALDEITAGDASGTITLRTTLAVEAPPPGTVLPASTPPPSAPDAGPADGIAL